MEGRCKKTQLKHLFHPCQFRFVSNSEYSRTLSKNSFNQEGTGKIQRCCNKAGALRPPWWPYRGQNIQESSLQASQHFQGTQTHYLALKKKKNQAADATSCDLLVNSQNFAFILEGSWILKDYCKLHQLNSQKNPPTVLKTSGWSQTFKSV